MIAPESIPTSIFASKWKEAQLFKHTPTNTHTQTHKSVVCATNMLSLVLIHDYERKPWHAQMEAVLHQVSKN